MDSSLGERFAYKQLENPKSALNADGLSLRESLEDRTGKPVYYFLFHSKPDGGPRDPGPCPICGGQWALKRDAFTLFNLKCDQCRVVAIGPRKRPRRSTESVPLSSLRHA